MQKHFVVIFFAALLCVFAAATCAFAANESAGKDAAGNGGKSVSSHTEAKVVFHIDTDQEEILQHGLDNIKNLLNVIPAEKTNVHMVANGTAVKLFTQKRVGAKLQEMEELAKLGVVFSLCRNALTSTKVQEKDLVPFCEIVPAGIVELITLQQSGYAYVKL